MERARKSSSGEGGREGVDERMLEALYVEGKMWDDLPDFLMGQAPRKVSHLISLIDIDLLPSGEAGQAVRIADIGCGAGCVLAGVSKALRERRKGMQVEAFGCDISPQAIEVARRENDEGVFECVGIAEVDRRFDLAIVADVMEHVPDPDDFLGEVARRARYFVVGYAMDDNAANRWSKKRRNRVHAVGHISLFDEQRARELTSRYGRILTGSYIRNPLGRNLRIRGIKSLLTLLPRIALQLLSPRMKGKVFGGETIYYFVESNRWRP